MNEIVLIPISKDELKVLIMDAVRYAVLNYLPIKDPAKNINDLTIDELEINYHTCSALKRAGYNKVIELNNLDYNIFSKMKGVGKKSIKELQYEIEKYGLKFERKYTGQILKKNFN